MINYKEYQGYLGADPQRMCDDVRGYNNILITEGLFEELCPMVTRKKYKKLPLYSLKDYEVKGLPSAYHIYMNSTDESEAALKLVGSLNHWSKLCSLRWFIKGRPEVGFVGIEQWRKDMAARDRTLAKKALMDRVAIGDVSAARALDKLAQESFKTAGIISSKKGQESSPEEEAHVAVLDQILGRGK